MANKILDSIMYGFANPQTRALMDARKQEQKERSQRFTKLAAAFDELGWMPKDEAMTRSLEDLEGMAQAKSLASELGSQEIQRRKQLAEIAAYEREVAQQNALSNAVRAAGSGVSRLPSPSAPGLLPDLEVPVNQPMTRQSLLAAFQQYPDAVNAPAGRQLLVEAFREQESGLPVESAFTEDPVSGMRFFSRGNTTLPSGVNPAVSREVLPAVPGYTPAPTGRGGYTWLKTPSGDIDVNQNIKLLELQLEAVLKDFTMPLPQKNAALAEINRAIEQLRQTKPAPQGGDSRAPNITSANANDPLGLFQ